MAYQLSIPVNVDKWQRRCHTGGMGMDTVGERIAARRRELGKMSQGEVARRARLKPPTISRYESGERLPTGDALVALARALQTSPEWIMTGQDPQAAADPLAPLREDTFVTLREAKRLIQEALGEASTQGTEDSPEGRRIVPRDAYRLRLVGPAAADEDDGEPLLEDEPDTDDFTLVVRGDCLTPRIRPNDRIEMNKHRRANVGDVVSVIINGERHVKELISRNGQWELKSNYGVVTLPLDGFRLEGVMTEHLRPVSEKEG